MYVSVPLAIQDDATGLVPVPLGFILSQQQSITVRYSEVHAFADVKARVERKQCLGSADVFAALIDGMVDTSADMLEKMSRDLAAVSGRAFGRRGVAPPRDKRFTGELRDCVNAVGTARDQLSHIRESLLGLQRIVGYVAEMTADWLLPALKSRLKTARQDLISLADFESHLSGKTQFLLDAILGFINSDQNDIFKVLTIVSVVGIPPHIDRQYVRYELPLRAGAELALGISVWTSAHCAQYPGAHCVVQAARVVVDVQSGACRVTI